MLGDDARERGVPAYAAIESVAANNDGSRRAGYTAPSPSGQAEVIRAAHERAGTLDGRVGYVEAHGTGTPLGDPIEVRGLSQVLAPSASGAPVRLGSLKANVGHLDVAAGIASLIKVALMRQRGEIPPQIRFERPNPELGIERTSLVIGAERAPWPEDRPYAGVSAFGIGGTNVHAVVLSLSVAGLGAPVGISPLLRRRSRAGPVLPRHGCSCDGLAVRASGRRRSAGSGAV